MSAETNRQNGRVYLDHAATTEVLPSAIDAMVEQMRAGVLDGGSGVSAQGVQ